MAIIKSIVFGLCLISLAQAGVVPHILNGETEEFSCPPNASGSFAHETACEKYYVCVNGSATELTCQDGFLFDLQLLTCFFAEQVDCGDRTQPTQPPPTTVPPTKPPVTGDYEFECPTPGGVFPHDIYCEKYFICANNVPKELTCPEGQLFDLKYDGCNFAELVFCGDRIRPNGTSTMIPTIVPSVTPDPGFECPAAGGAFEHPDYCELFYLCVDNKPTLEICPPDQLFDLVWSGCNWADLVDCGDRIRPNGTATARPTTTAKTTTTKKPGTGPTEAPGTGPTDPPPGEFECPSADGMFADPKNCAAYYQCSNFIAYPNDCPGELVFNEEAGVCDYKENVECGTRPLP